MIHTYNLTTNDPIPTIHYPRTKNYNPIVGSDRMKHQMTVKTQATRQLFSYCAMDYERQFN